MFLLILILLVIPLLISILSPFWLTTNKKLPPLKQTTLMQCKQNKTTLLKQYLILEDAYKKNKLTEKEWLIEKETLLKQYTHLIQLANSLQ